MPTNDFLPFGTAGGANVMSQAAYVALSRRTGGFLAGTAQSVQCNKVWRQASIATASLAQFMVDTTGGDVLDNGDVAGFQDILYAAIRGQALNYFTPGGTANAITLAMAPAPASWAVLAGTPLRLLVTTANTSTAVTVTPTGLTGKSVAYNDGSLPQVGDLLGLVELVYNATQDKVQILSISRSGILNVQRSQIRADRIAATQVIPTDVITKVTSYGEVNLVTAGGSTFSSGTLTIGAGDAGLWYIAGYCRQGFGSNSGQATYVYVNSNPVVSDGGPSAVGGWSIVHASASRIVSLAAGDTVDMRFVQTTGGNITFNDLYSFTAVRLGNA